MNTINKITVTFQSATLVRPTELVPHSKVLYPEKKT